MQMSALAFVSPSLSVGTIFVSPRFVAEGIAIIGFPRPSNPMAAPRIKSICPPNPTELTTTASMVTQ